MISLYIGSTSPYSGKSLICIGLGRQFEKDGLGIGYFKPVGYSLTREAGQITDENAVFVKQALSLDEPLDELCPVIVTQDMIIQAYKGKVAGLDKKVMEAHKRLSKDKDIVLIGGGKNIYDGAFLGVSGISIIKRLDARVILVDKYEEDVYIDCVLAVKEALEDRLAGVIMNRVSREDEGCLKRRAVPFLEERGIPVLGMLPYDSLLNAVTVGELKEILNGEIICCEDRVDDLVESFSVGAMNVDSALKYFRLKKNKAVITGGDRSDIQLAALETSVKCLLLTGNLYPNDIIINQAEERNVPIMIVKNDTFSTIEECERILGRIRIRDERKVKRAVDMVREHIQFERVYEILGLSLK
ncbi:phosphotransacetylase family protein [bacterium]|nr:phosphotransacetylase family protein [bacterium]